MGWSVWQKRYIYIYIYTVGYNNGYILFINRKRDRKDTIQTSQFPIKMANHSFLTVAYTLVGPDNFLLANATGIQLVIVCLQ